ncbi:hypothetical protein HP15_1987 [Marinobacter adhaerens HP15]|uniref:Uncharacterized protein n=1 Tax=Marinobacter adhaerens (strain DSM 23420 / HP15) TaxID=225937 RepID=E4PQN1_MARAH|nr:hypothetical protein HP15_1987 [Marinobacter adhaerens HP15]
MEPNPALAPCDGKAEPDGFALVCCGIGDVMVVRPFNGCGFDQPNQE